MVETVATPKRIRVLPFIIINYYRNMKKEATNKDNNMQGLSSKPKEKRRTRRDKNSVKSKYISLWKGSSGSHKKLGRVVSNCIISYRKMGGGAQSYGSGFAKRIPVVFISRLGCQMAGQITRCQLVLEAFLDAWKVGAVLRPADNSLL